MVRTNTDIEDRKRAEIDLAGEKHVLEMIALGRPLREVLTALCRLFQQSAPDCHCGIHPIDGRSKTFEFGVAPSLPASLTNPIERAPVGSDDSPHGRSISEKTQVIVEDIVSDPRWMTAPCRSHVLEHGLRAVWSSPICSQDGSVNGTICVYRPKPGSPSAHHREIIAHVAQLAGIAIERSQAEAARRLAEEGRDKTRSELAHISRVASLGALTASIAHEVNQPLASIVTRGETGLRWLDQPDPNFEKVRQVLTHVVSDARRAADIIDRIRTMASKGAPKRSEAVLAEIITECAALLHHELQSKNVSISLDLASDLPMVEVDRTQLQQVIVNLVINAVQAVTSSEVGRRSIAIRTQQADAETICCIVEDSGPGIDAEHLPRLFDSFFTTRETGMGLGLPIARSIIEMHNGDIRADNGSVLGGARLTIELPAG